MDKKLEYLLDLKKMLENGVISQEEFDVKKKEILAQVEEDDKKSKKKNIIIFAVVFVFFILPMLSVIINNTSSSEEASDNPKSKNEVMVDSISQKFAEDCPIIVDASLSRNILNYPVLKCKITNNVDKQIAAIKLYVVPQNVYGEEVSSFMINNRLLYDEIIDSKSTVNASWDLYDDKIKKGKVYVYSVYYIDGTEWGNRELGVDSIKKYAKQVDILG